MRFEFSTATRILFGPGTASDAGTSVAAYGKRALLVTGHDTSRATALRASLESARVAVVQEAVSGEPTVGRVREAAEHAREERCAVVVAFGGGSALDAGKAVAAMLTNAGDPLRYLEVIGEGRPLLNRSAPFIAIPTTAGTGSEVTRNAVLCSPEHGVKASLRSAGMLPVLAIVDPALSLGLPRPLTASTGFDALTQLIEPFVCTRANPVADAFCREGIPLVARSLRRAAEHPADLEARTDMALASLLGGLALANAGLGAVHGFAAPVGGRFHAPHGAICAALLPHATRANLQALRSRQPTSAALGRYREVASLLTGDPNARADDAVEWLTQLALDLDIPPLGHWGVTAGDVGSLAAQAVASSSMKANPLALTVPELETLAAAAI